MKKNAMETIAPSDRRDPVCGMTVSLDTPHRIEHAGRTYLFCSAGCLAKFRAEPDRHLSSRPHADRMPPPLPAAGAVEWTCPMHPQIVRDEPGTCPISGMALEPRTVTLEEEENPELVDMTRRFWVSALLSVPLIAIAMGHLFPGDPIGRLLPHGGRNFVELALASPVVLW
jgi:YHS domain-containing protein